MSDRDQTPSEVDFKRQWDAAQEHQREEWAWQMFDALNASLVPVEPPVLTNVASQKPLGEKLSVDKRRTLRNQAWLDRGLHPVSRRALRGEGTCGECDHCVRHGRYIKCDLNATNGPGTDIRLKWPACVSFSESGEPRE